ERENTPPPPPPPPFFPKTLNIKTLPPPPPNSLIINELHRFSLPKERMCDVRHATARVDLQSVCPVISTGSMHRIARRSESNDEAIQRIIKK
ncbi:MAG: hypothetical protein FWG84_06615, partial [Bacteroidales bacterium]|nr:hypothetical protein [Bacteroidales bacterium]